MPDSILFWNKVALEANRESHTHDHGEQTGPPLSARALAIVHLAMYDAYVGQAKANGGTGTDAHYLPAAELPTAQAGGSPDAAIAGAASHALSELFPTQKAKFDTLAGFIKDANVPGSFTVKNLKDGYEYGEDMAMALLDRRKNDPDASPVDYKPTPAPGRWQSDPDNPGQQAHGPHYGELSKLFATSKRYESAKPPEPKSTDAEYMRALRQVRSKGIEPTRLDSVSDQYDQYTVVANDTLRKIAQRFYGDENQWPRIHAANQYQIANPDLIQVGQVLRIPTGRTLDETVAGMFWGYDGAVNLGTPPRLYNQIVRKIADAKGNTIAQNARLFALINVAMADAGILCWEQKYRYDYWRPVTGIREHGGSLGTEGEESTIIDTDADPWWLPLGAPNTNTLLREPYDAKRLKNFTPPFPAYPSGHATFGAAALHITRRFYGRPSGDRAPDQLFEDAAGDNMGAVSDEFNGVNQDNTGTARPQHAREFKNGLWGMIEENSRSRVYLGVHWVFDGFAVNAANIPQLGKDVNLPAGVAGVGGVPLGLAIADDIFDTGMLATTGDAAGLPSVAAFADGMSADELARLTRIAPRQPWPLG